MSTPSHRVQVLRFARTLALAAAGGAVLTVLNVPAGWLLGAMVTVSATTLSGVATYMPRPTLAAASIFFGISIGSSATPEAVAQLPGWMISLLLLLLSLGASVAACSLHLRRNYGWDADTARLSAMPGALPTVLLMAAEANVPLARVAVSQSIRQTVLVLTMPLLLLLMPGERSAATTVVPSARWDELLTLIAISCAAAFAARLLRIPSGLLIGSMLASAAMHATGFLEARPPEWMMVGAFVLTGALIGSRLHDTSMQDIVTAIRPATESVAIAMAISAAFAGLATLVVPAQFSDIWLAFAPGGVEAMIALAFALNLDPLFVGVHHFFRLLALSALAPGWGRRRHVRDGLASIHNSPGQSDDN
jgi:hypothetical protein